MAVGHPFAERWNHNTHYYPLLADAVPASARTVLDVGCGEGSLARYLATPGRLVVGLDADATMLANLRDAGSSPTRDAGSAHPVAGSATALPVADTTIDALCLVMVLHHCDPGAVLVECRRVLRPGGVLQVLGYGSSERRDVGWELRDLVAHRWHRRGRVGWEPDTAKAPPSMTWRASRQLFAEQLPGSHYRRLSMWRYLVRWQQSATARAS